MEPQFNSAPSMDVAPHASETSQNTSEKPTVGASPEFAARPEAAPPAPATLPPVDPSAVAISAPPTIPQVPPASVTTKSAPPPEPSTNEELERMYIQKAKEIVMRTASDPYIQSREIGRLKAESIKQIHAKDVKVAE
ncbi:MAG TPA: hypothetical protein VHT70_03305 [Candidatus Saccharimonadales bacterium]|nr:hypothetical protein [Candidatus Saccharimonadales bacterium]